MTILTPPVISKLPLGLLGFFQIKNGGQYPQTLGGSINPTFEQLELLAANYHENLALTAIPTVTGFIGATVVATALPAVVPAGELWYASSLSMHVTTGVGDSINFSPEARSFQTNNAAAFHRVLAGPVTQPASLAVMYQCNYQNQDRWFSPGDTFGYWVTAITLATAIQMSIQAQITRFPF